MILFKIKLLFCPILFKMSTINAPRKTAFQRVACPVVDFWVRVKIMHLDFGGKNS